MMERNQILLLKSNDKRIATKKEVKEKDIKKFEIFKKRPMKLVVSYIVKI